MLVIVLNYPTIAKNIFTSILKLQFIVYAYDVNPNQVKKKQLNISTVFVAYMYKLVWVINMVGHNNSKILIYKSVF